MIGQFICDQTGQNSTDDGTIATLEQNFILAIQKVTRQKVTSPTLNFYVDAVNGNDTNTGTASGAGGAKKTIGAAISAAYSQYDYNGNTLTINVAAGTYNEAVNITGLPLGCSLISLIGNNTSPSSVTISVTSNNAISITNSFAVVQGFTIQASGTGGVGYGLVMTESYVTGQNLVFGSCGNVQLAGASLTQFNATGPITFQGSSTWGVAAESASQMFLNSITITFAGGCTYNAPGAWALATQAGFLNVVSTTFSGTFTGQRFNGNFCGGFSVNGAAQTYFPGSSAGILANNAVYA